MRIVALFIFAFVLLAGCVRIKRDHRIEIEYPDEQPQSDVAEMFAPDLISTDSIEHSSPSFSPDGKRVLWSVMQMPTYKAVIFEMTFAGGSWSKPHVAPFADTSASDIYPTFSHDGTMLYFSSSRKLPSGVIPPRGNMLWRVRLEGET